MTLTITGATGHLGRIVVETLLARGVSASDIVATGRTTERIADLAEQGVTVRRADFDDPLSLATAFDGTQRLLLVSGSEVGRRRPQHQAAVDAAKLVGVGFVAYTSITKADTSGLLLADEHRFTEHLLAESGIPHALLRNCWYLENYLGQVPGVVASGVVLGAAGEGRVSAALRSEYGQAAATVIAGGDHDGAVYELGGEGFTMAQFAAAVASASGTLVTYRELTESDLTAALVGVGLDPGYATVLADADLGIARDDLFTDTGDLERLIGRPPTTMQAAVAASFGASG